MEGLPPKMEMVLPKPDLLPENALWREDREGSLDYN
jgi:hypothetical protein